MKNILCYTAILIFLASCGTSEKTKEASLEAISKVSNSDPFKSSMIKSEIFELEMNSDTAFESLSGTVLFIPEGAFLNEDGTPYDSKVQLEYSEALNPADLLVSNIETTDSEGKPVATAATFFLNATTPDGQQLKFNPESPVYLEFPEENGKDFQLAHGVRDENGKMKWNDPKPIENWLVSVYLDLLDFLPEGFERAVEEGLPYRNYKSNNKHLSDSLYYSLQPGNINLGQETPGLDYMPLNLQESDSSSCLTCGINPASIKTLKDKKFQNTLISTREFQVRLGVIFKTCRQDVLDIYTSNLDKNLWECDSLAGLVLAGSTLQGRFKAFASEKLTKVKEGRTNASALSEFYKRKLKKLEKEIEKQRKDARKQVEKDNALAEKKRKEYAELLRKRERYRMQKMGLCVHKPGWHCLCKPVVLKAFELDVVVPDGNDFDRIHVYVLNERIHSLFSLVAADKVHFSSAYAEDRHLLLWEGQEAKVVATAFKGNKEYFDEVKFYQTDKIRIELKPVLSENGVKEEVTKWDKASARINQIMEDLEYQEFFYQDNLRRKRLHREEEFLEKLRYFAFNCFCETENADAVAGRDLFNSNCKQCHSIDKVVVGPALKGVAARRTLHWIIDFTRNSQQVIKNQDPVGRAMFDKYSGTVMPSFKDLSDQNIKDIIAFVECEGKKRRKVVYSEE